MTRLLSILLIIITIIAAGSCKKSKIYVGAPYQGGIIFYVDGSGEHGLIAAPSDYPDPVSWSNGNDTVRTTASATAVGTGKANTAALVQQLGVGNYAAYVCDQLVLNGYDDWFLPSQEELYMLCGRRGKIGGFQPEWYWGSTDLLGQPRAPYAINAHFGTGSTKFNGAMNKGEKNRVRPVRSF